MAKKETEKVVAKPNGEPEYGSILPHYGFYGIQGWDCLVKGYPIIHHPTKGKATKWMKDHGFGII